MPVWRQLLGPGLSAGGTPVVRLLTDANLPLLTVAAVLGLLFLAQMAGHRTEQAIRRLAGTMLGVVCLGGLAAVVLAIRVRFGMASLVLFLAAVKVMDIGAYFVGTAFGRHKLIPWLSPGKRLGGPGRRTGRGDPDLPAAEPGYSEAGISL